jgi:PIN domain nuclease of toxin-antitoxin system
MRYLIDTNIFLFSIIDTERLTKKVRQILEGYDDQVYFSAESIKEIIQLLQIGKVVVKQWKKPEDAIDFIANETNFEIKYVREEHLRTLAKLPLFIDHRDPSDRVIIAQAITEKIPLVSSDKKFFLYKDYGLDFIFNGW